MHYADSIRSRNRKIPNSPRFLLLEKISANNFPLSHAEDNTVARLSQGRIANLTLLKIQ